MGKELLNTLEIAWASIVLLIAGVDTGGDAAEVEAGVVCTGNHERPSVARLHVINLSGGRPKQS